MKHCPKCGGRLVADNEANIEAMLKSRLKAMAGEWHRDGKLSSRSYEELGPLLDKSSPFSGHAGDTVKGGSVIIVLLLFFQKIVSGFFAGISGLFEIPVWIRERKKTLHVRFRGKDRSGDVDVSLTTAGALSGGKGSAIWDGGLDAIADLDSHKGGHGRRPRHRERERGASEGFSIWAGLKPLYNEYIWWFIGSILVLSGSIMGVREAWLALTGIPKHTLVLSALFIYHLLFVAFSAVINRKSAVAGKLLAGVSLSLLPVLYSITSDIMAIDAGIGVVALGIITVAATATLSVLARLFNIGLLRLLLAVLPAMAAIALIPLFRNNPLGGMALTFAGIISVAFSAEYLKKSGDGAAQAKTLLVISLYSAFSAIFIFFVSSSIDFTAGSVQIYIFLLWCLALFFILSSAFRALSYNSKLEILYITLDILCLAGVMASVLAAAAMRMKDNGSPSMDVIIIALIIPAAGAFSFLRALRRYTPALHPLMVSASLGALILSLSLSRVPVWMVFSAALVPCLGLAAHEKFGEKFRLPLIIWGLAAGISAVFFTLITILYGPVQDTIVLPVLFTCVLLAASAHYGAGWNNRALHYAGGFGVFVLAIAVSAVAPFQDSGLRWLITWSAYSFIYGIAGALLEKSAGNSDRALTSIPFDDLSLATIIPLFFIALTIPVPQGNFILDDPGGWAMGGFNFTNAALALTVIFLRAGRDRSRIVSFAGVLLVTIILFRLSFASLSGASALVFAALALAWGITAALIPGDSGSEGTARLFFGFLRLPFYARGGRLFRDGFAAASALCALIAVVNMAAWIKTLAEPDRNYAILAGLLLIALGLAAFVTKSFSAWEARGNVATLFIVLVFIGLTAVVNRIGRPLPPQVVGFNLTLAIIGVWGVSIIFRRKGEALARLLGREGHGGYYHLVPLTGVSLLGLLLLVDAILVGGPFLSRALYVTPPTFFIGAGLAVYFVARASKLYHMANASLLFFIITGILAAAQESLTGIPLTALDPPGGRWVPAAAEQAIRAGSWLDPAVYLPPYLNRVSLWQRGEIGTAVTACLYSLAALGLAGGKSGAVKEVLFPGLKDGELPEKIFSQWVLASIVIIGLFSLNITSLYAMLIIIISGGILFFSGRALEGIAALFLSGLLAVHAAAHLFPAYPFWPGPVLALLGFLFILMAGPLAGRYKFPYDKGLEAAHFGALIYSAAGFAYALAASSPADAANAFSSLSGGVMSGLSGAWAQKGALSLTSFIVSCSLVAGARQWRDSLSSAAALLGGLMLSFAAFTATPCLYSLIIKENQASSPVLMISLLPLLALVFSGAAAVLQQAALSLSDKRDDMAAGFAAARDAVIVTAGLMLGIVMQAQDTSRMPRFMNIMVPMAVIVLTLVAIRSAWKEMKARHLYFAQTGIAALYISLKSFSGMDIPPEVDSIFALLFGFILVGVTVMARRLGVPPSRLRPAASRPSCRSSLSS